MAFLNVLWLDRFLLRPLTWVKFETAKSQHSCAGGANDPPQ